MSPQNGGSLAAIQSVIDGLKDKPGALLPILHGIQDKLGYIPEEAIAPIGLALKQTRAEIHGVISFYHHFRTAPAGAHIVQICRAEACQSVGARSLEAHARDTLGIAYHQTSADHRITLEPVYCLGNCACGPSVRIDDRVHGRVSSQRFDQLVEQLQVDIVELQV